MYLLFKESYMKRTGYILAILGLSVVCVGLGVALYFNTNTMSGHASNLEGVYQKSLYELIDNGMDEHAKGYGNELEL